MIAEVIFYGSFIAAAVAGVCVCLLRQARDRRRRRGQINQRVDEAIATIMADGKVVIPKGKFKYKNWARKWMGYSHSLPPPRPGSQQYIQGREMPRLPKDDE
jgi:hypothetical protein